MEQQDWNNLGSQIVDSVAGALNTGNFTELNKLVADTVNSALDEAKKQAEAERTAFQQSMGANAANYEKWAQQQEEIRRRQEERREEWRKRQEQRMAEEYRQRKEQEEALKAKREAEAAKRAESGEAARPARPPRAARVRFNRLGSVANVFNTIFGSLGLTVGVAFGIVTIILFATGGIFPGSLIWLAITLGVFGCSVSLLDKGSSQRKVLKRAERYIDYCGKDFCGDLTGLANYVGKSVRYVKKDLKKMIAKGMFPEGHLDERNNLFFLSDEAFKRHADSSRTAGMQPQDAVMNQEQGPEAEDELTVMVRQGSAYIRRLHELNALIPGEEITGQLDQLENLLKQMFQRVKEHPEQMGRMSKLMDYYLPTTIKLVEAYVQFEKVETPGQDILDAKREIHKTLDVINNAFVELLNNLFQDEVFDATTDAQVLQTMLAREGLHKEVSIAPGETRQEAPTQLAQEIPVVFDLPEVPEQTGESEATVFPQTEGADAASQSEVPNVLKAPWET